jgi:large subunit ribosomal protein L15
MDLEKFENGSKITLETYFETGLVKNAKNGIKVLGEGKLTKKLNVQAHKFSASAAKAIEAAGGTVEVI